MNEYSYCDLSVGMAEHFEHVVTQNDMDNFRMITGDVNPLHNDEAFAKMHGFENAVVFGMLTSSLLSTLGGVYLPGKYCIIHQVETKYLAPVYVGDTLMVTGTVYELNDSVRRAVIKVEIHNQQKKKVVKGKLFVGFIE